ncbi:hypothetical protein H257_11119 [Aphanomyces astaci]|uniref:Uncharacterized protein n=1 Tax=Aphanomyces astaci TaxID=112090 RepID=W4G5F3_APHAT|nr:hypothetical protein H257_11119 [Aphanomyces astaci]ETV74153.1 hypothetical protein H257_11119 [Aphanomyces astaci]|eukprot:XP_009836259.1 hypothetical protein H257_11119 [Aphanomyces astaci]
MELWLKHLHLHDCLLQNMSHPHRRLDHPCPPPAYAHLYPSASQLKLPFRSDLHFDTAPMYSPPTYLPLGQRSDHNAISALNPLRQILPPKDRSQIFPIPARDFPPFSAIAPTGTPSPRSYIQCFLLDLRTAESPPAPAQLPIHTQAQRLHTIDAYAHQIAEINCYKHGRSMLEGTPISSFRPPANNMANGWRSTLTSRHPRRPMGSSTSARPILPSSRLSPTASRPAYVPRAYLQRFKRNNAGPCLTLRALPSNKPFAESSDHSARGVGSSGTPPVKQCLDPRRPSAPPPFDFFADALHVPANPPQVHQEAHLQTIYRFSLSPVPSTEDITPPTFVGLLSSAVLLTLCPAHIRQVQSRAGACSHGSRGMGT